jgi:hypothetical protein
MEDDFTSVISFHSDVVAMKGSGRCQTSAPPPSPSRFFVRKLNLEYKEDMPIVNIKPNKLRGPWSASELYRLSERHLSMKFSANFLDRGVLHGQRGRSRSVVNLSFLDWSRYFSF